MEANILVVDDEVAIASLVEVYLKNEGFIVHTCHDAAGALACVNNEALDLAILDVMLPYVDGWTLCRKVKEKSDIPVLFLTARGEEYDELMGFELGADDYIKKPFSPAVLLVRVKRLLGKEQRKMVKNNIIVKDNLEIDKDAMKVKLEGVFIELTHKEYQILTYLVENEGKALSREMILTEVWGYDYVGEDRVVDNHIKKIRKALGEYAYMVRTVFGVGYIFEV